MPFGASWSSFSEEARSSNGSVEEKEPKEMNGCTSQRRSMETQAPGTIQKPSGTLASELQTVKGRNHWIVLDAAWAQQLGIGRTGGRYRIRSSELMVRLTQLAEDRTSDAPSVTGTGVPTSWATGQETADDVEVVLVSVIGSEDPGSAHAAA
jgi:hypothetical protein